MFEHWIRVFSGLAFRLVLVACILAAPCSLRAEGGIGLVEAGLRGGVDFNEDDTAAEALEAYLLFDLGRQWEAGDDYTFRLQGLVGLGALRIREDTTATCHLGPAVEIAKGSCPVRLRVSSGPAWLFDDHPGGFDLGTRIQFASAGTLSWEFDGGWVASYTYQHLSNAGLDNRNPGVNTSLFGLGHRF